MSRIDQLAQQAAQTILTAAFCQDQLARLRNRQDKPNPGSRFMTVEEIHNVENKTKTKAQRSPQDMRTIERDWITKAGLRAVVIANDRGYRCGYVGVASSEIFSEAHLNNNLFTVHGGITYSDSNSQYPVESNLHWLGFDCMHFGDGVDPSILAENIPYYPNPQKIVRTLEFCVAECENLALQLAKGKIKI